MPAPIVLFLLAGTTQFVVPADWNDEDNLIEVVSAGGHGDGNSTTTSRTRGGAGAGYVAASNLSYAPGQTISCLVPDAGAGGQVVAFFDSISVLAVGCGENAPTGGSIGAAGGIAYTGTVKYNGGGSGSASIRTGGGGAAGPNGPGGYSASIQNSDGGSANGGLVPGGAGALATSAPAGDGNSAVLWTETGTGRTAGVGSGGGGGSAQNGRGGNGGLYGGGGGGAKSAPGLGQPGIIVITYTPKANARSLAASPAIYAANGRPAQIVTGHRLTASAAALACTGQPAGLRRRRSVAAAAGALFLSGGHTVLARARRLVGGTGAIAATGNPVRLRRDQRLGAGAFALVLRPAGLMRRVREGLSDSGLPGRLFTASAIAQRFTGAAITAFRGSAGGGRFR